MRKLFAWLGVAALAVVCSARISIAAPNDPLKPYIVLILDTSGSMLQATGSGPPSCGGTDTKLNHARCAINKITNSYGDIVFALGRFRSEMGGTTTAATFPAGCCTAGPAVAANGACPAGPACTNGNNMLEILTPLVDGNTSTTASWVNFTGNTCTAVGTDPEIWNADSNTPLEGSLNGAKRYWSGQQATDTAAGTGDAFTVAGGVVTLTDAAALFLPNHSGRVITIAGAANANNNGTFVITQVVSTTQIRYNNAVGVAQANYAGAWSIAGATMWPSGVAGFDPITNDPTNTAFLAPAGQTTCNPNPGTCSVAANCGTTNNCCCISQCRPYITILLTDGAETCTGNPAGAGVGADALLRTDLANKRYRIETKPIGFGIAPGDAQIEAIAHAGGAANGAGNEGFYASNEADLELAISSILAGAVRTEVCNGRDDDCDTFVDEGFTLTGTCNNGRVGKCLVNGTPQCRADGTNTECNAGLAACVAHAANQACTVQNASGANVAGTCQSNGVSLACVVTAAVDSAPAVHDAEIPFGCNGIDDDCDGIVDEGVTGCSCIPQGETCNNLDDNCNGMIDEGITRPCGTGVCLGIETCAAGAFSGCTAQVPVAETCNGLDDDCDGNKDGFTQACSNLSNGFPALDPKNNPGGTHNPMSGCELEGPAICVCHPGNRTCPLNGAGVFGACTGEAVPGVEICNGIDDDCDGLVDEAPGTTCTNSSTCPPITPTCNNPTGMANMGTCQPADCSSNCGVGQLICVNGAQQCNSVPAPNDDTCNGIDDNCNGQIDEGWTCTNANCTCTAPGVCNGHEACTAGHVTCTGNPISQESCNCLDDDCDGLTDEGSLCGSGATCTNCQCAFQCSPGEFPCPLGKKCVGNFCIADPCFGVNCPNVNGNKQVCSTNPNMPNEAVCVDVCSTVTCPGGYLCIGATGECRPDDCTTFPERCTAAQNCVVNGTGFGVCVSNPCQGVTCAADQYCVGGNCFGSCANVDCPTGKRCEMGSCVTDPCGHPCPFGKTCHDETGQCVDDPCQFVQCPQGQYCNAHNNGVCEDDPCVGTHCPNPGEVCKGGTCYDPAQFLPDAGVEQHVTTGGGGGCSTTNGGAGLLVGLALIVTRRRRRDGGRS